MITRRTLAVGTGAMVTGIALGRFFPRPAIATEFGFSSRLLTLADAWKETWAAFDQVWGAAWKAAKSNEQPGVASEEAVPPVWLGPVQASFVAGLRVLDEPAQTRSDVILKYYAIDNHYGVRPVPDWMWLAGGGPKLCRMIELEARGFDLAINPFWNMTASPFAEIDGDRWSPAWGDVERWITA